MKRSKMSLMPWVGGAVSLVFATTAMAAQPLVDAAWVKDHSCDPNVRVLDIRNKWDGSRKGDYQKGHIPVQSTPIIHRRVGEPRSTIPRARCPLSPNSKN